MMNGFKLCKEFLVSCIDAFFGWWGSLNFFCFLLVLLSIATVCTFMSIALFGPKMALAIPLIGQVILLFLCR